MHIIWVERNKITWDKLGESRLEITEPLLIVGFKTEFLL